MDLAKIQSVVDSIQKSAMVSRNPTIDVTGYFQVWDAFRMQSIVYSSDKKAFQRYTPFLYTH